jgi:hypothetical protein
VILVGPRTNIGLILEFRVTLPASRATNPGVNVAVPFEDKFFPWTPGLVSTAQVLCDFSA